jgi:DNA-binding transcriptional LysR family regulator
MTYSTDALHAFAQAAHLGSFSAAARRLGKRQSTISMAIAQLEIDLNVQLFDRTGHKPSLTPAGQVLLQQVNLLLHAHTQLAQTAQQLGAGLEATLSLVLSDTYQSDVFEGVMRLFARQFPTLALHCQIAEEQQLIELVDQGHAQLGLINQQTQYPPAMSAQPLREPSYLSVYVSRQHPLAQSTQPLSLTDLHSHRALLLTPQQSTHPCAWYAPSYMMLLEMTMLGAGWAVLPRWLTERYSHQTLCELHVIGYPQHHQIDLIYSRQYPLGIAGQWLKQTLLDADHSNNISVYCDHKS